MNKFRSISFLKATYSFIVTKANQSSKIDPSDCRFRYICIVHVPLYLYIGSICNTFMPTLFDNLSTRTWINFLSRQLTCYARPFYENPFRWKHISYAQAFFDIACRFVKAANSFVSLKQLHTLNFLMCITCTNRNFFFIVVL